MAKTLRRLLCVFTVSLLSLFIFIHPASSDESANKEIPLNQYGIRSTDPFVVDRFIENGREIEAVIVPGPPHPPAGSVRAEVANLPVPDIAAGTNTISNVPAMTWVFGCSATSAAMMFGHYDNSGYPNMYAGPENGGVFPMTNAAWGTTVISGETRALCPLSATRNGLDGRMTRGHVDDYWIKVDNAGPDPFIGNWTEHTQGECTGDYMGTNKSSLGNVDGSTTFYYNLDNSPLYDYVAPSGRRDGCYGMKRFVASRGYTVQSNGNFNQRISGYGGKTAGFTYANFKAEIDAGRPVLIQVVGHTMLGYGYNDPSTIYIHDTWDYLDHSMTWGGTYSDMQHTGVTVLRLTPPSGVPPVATTLISPSGTITTTTPTYTWNAVSNASYYLFWINGSETWYTASSAGCGSGTGTCSVTGSALAAGSYNTWYVRTYNSYGYGPWSSGKGFTISGGGVPPVATTLISPSGTITTTTPTYTWNAVSNASYYLFWINGSETWYTASSAGCGSGTGTCSVTGSALAAGSYNTWYVRTWNSAGYGPWSSGMNFNVGVVVVLPTATTLISPSGTITTTTPTYIWNAVSNASYYLFWINGSETWYTASSAGCGSGTGTCSVTGSALAAGSYNTWYVRTWNSAGYGPWSSGMGFTIATGGGGFNEHFTSNPTHWSQDSGSWSWNRSGWWYTAGTSGLSSQSTYNATYSNFDYSARLWRSGSTTSSSNRLWVRASSSTDSTGWPLNGYAFQYTTDGYYSVWKTVNGVHTAIQDWTWTSAINTGSAWNTLRVYASGSSGWFYINGALVATGTDFSISSGRVGVGMYRDSTSTGNEFYVDWATLTIPSAAVNPSDEQVSEAQLLLNQHPAGGRSADDGSTD
jgi:hypothetical protein